MFKIGYRTIKTAIGAPVAIFIAQLLQLDYAISAAVITMLCIQTTRRASYLKAWIKVLFIHDRCDNRWVGI